SRCNLSGCGREEGQCVRIEDSTARRHLLLKLPGFQPRNSVCTLTVRHGSWWDRLPACPTAKPHRPGVRASREGALSLFLECFCLATAARAGKQGVKPLRALRLSTEGRKGDEASASDFAQGMGGELK